MKKLLITGANGLVGSAIMSLENDYPEFKFIPIYHSYGDLTDSSFVENMFQLYEPDLIIHTAAKVGGIGLNLNKPVQQFNDNILMNTQLIEAAHWYGVEKLIAFSSVCVFPADTQILKEENLHNGPPFPAHWSYAMAKRMVDVQIEAYRKQHNSNFMSLIPGNLYGINDNFNLEEGHVLPSLIHKCFLAKNKAEFFKIWGDGSSMREFIYSKDVAKICLELMKKNTLPQRLIVSGEQETMIKDVVFKICQEFDYHKVEWQHDKPNGQKNRPTDKTVFKTLFPDFKFTNLDDGIKETVDWFKKAYPDVRK